MKKVKKVIVLALTLLIVPIALAGCSFGDKTLAKSKNQVWYVFEDKKDANDLLESVLIVNKNKIKEYDVDGVDTNIKYSQIKGKNASEVESYLKKYDLHPETFDVSYQIYVDQNKKTVEEALKINDTEKHSDTYYAIVGSSETLKVDGQELHGFKTLKTYDGYEVSVHSDEYLVTDSDKVKLDSGKTKGITQYNTSELNNLLNESNE